MPHPASRLVAAARGTIDAVLAVLLLSIVLITLAQVFWRYVIGAAFLLPEEMNLMLWAWMIALGSIVVGHLRITMIAALLPLPVQIALAVAQAAVSIALLAVLGIYGWKLAAVTWADHFGDIGPLRRGHLFLSIPVAALPWAAASVADAVRAIGDLRAGRQVNAGGGHL